MPKTERVVVWIKAEAMSRQGKKVLFHGEGDEAGRALPTIRLLAQLLNNE
jgi:hypothetical protein